MGIPFRLRDGSGRAHRGTIDSDGTVVLEGSRLHVRTAVDGSLQIAAEGAPTVTAWAAVDGARRWVFLNGAVFEFEADDGGRSRRRSVAHAGALTAPMPATVRKVAVAEGDAVRRGDVLIVLEAMKMELPVRAPGDGTVRAVHCREGEMVQHGQELAELSDP